MKILKILFNLSLLFLSLGQLSSIFKQGSTSLYAFDIFLLLFVSYGLYYFLYVKKSFVLPSVSLLFLSFSFVALLSLFRVIPLYSNSELLVSFLYLVRWVLYLLSGLVVFNMLDKNLITKEYITSRFVLSGVIISILGFMQLLIFPDLSVLDSSLGWDPHKNRLFSTFLDPNFVGAYLNILLIFLFNKYYSKEEFFSTIDGIIFGVFLLALFLTFSRSAWLVLSFTILIYGLYKSKLLLLTFFIVSFSTYFAVPRIQTRISGITDPSDSAHFRLISWGNTLDIAKDNLFLGVGFNTFRYAQRELGLLSYGEVKSHGASSSDSSLLFVLATTGILGFLFYLGGFVHVFFKTKHLMIKTLIFGLLVNSFFINSLFYPQIMFLWIVIVTSYYSFDI